MAAGIPVFAVAGADAGGFGSSGLGATTGSDIFLAATGADDAAGLAVGGSCVFVAGGAGLVAGGADFDSAGLVSTFTASSAAPRETSGEAGAGAGGVRCGSEAGLTVGWDVEGTLGLAGALSGFGFSAAAGAAATFGASAGLGCAPNAPFCRSGLVACGVVGPVVGSLLSVEPPLMTGAGGEVESALGFGWVADDGEGGVGLAGGLGRELRSWFFFCLGSDGVGVISLTFPLSFRLYKATLAICQRKCKAKYICPTFCCSFFIWTDRRGSLSLHVAICLSRKPILSSVECRVPFFVWPSSLARPIFQLT